MVFTCEQRAASPLRASRCRLSWLCAASSLATTSPPSWHSLSLTASTSASTCDPTLSAASVTDDSTSYRQWLKYILLGPKNSLKMRSPAFSGGLLLLLLLLFLLFLLLPRYGCKVLWWAYLFVYLSVCSHIWKTTRSNFTKCSVHVTCGYGSVLLSRQCDMLCYSGFVDEVMFSHNRVNAQNQRQRVCFIEFARWRHRERSSSSPTTSCIVYF